MPLLFIILINGILIDAQHTAVHFLSTGKTILTAGAGKAFITYFTGIIGSSITPPVFLSVSVLDECVFVSDAEITENVESAFSDTEEEIFTFSITKSPFFKTSTAV